MVKFARARLRRSRGFDAFDEFVNGRSLTDVDDSIRIWHAKIYLIAYFQLVADDFLPVHESAVAAAHIFKYHRPADVRDLSLLPAHAAVSQREFISCLAADTEREVGNGDVAARAIRINYDKPWTARHSSLSPRRVRS